MVIRVITSKVLQRNTEELINSVIFNDDALYVESEKGAVVIISLDEWNILRELLNYEMNRV